MSLLCVVFSVCESMPSFYKVAGGSPFAEEALAKWTLLFWGFFLLFFFFPFSPEINRLLLCFWFPGSWLVLPGQNLNTAPLFSPQEQCSNVESIPILTEDAQNWIWVEVGSYDAWGEGHRGNQKNQTIPQMASNPPDSFKEAPRHWEGFVSLSWQILSTGGKVVIFSSTLQNSIPPGAGVLPVALLSLSLSSKQPGKGGFFPAYPKLLSFLHLLQCGFAACRWVCEWLGALLPAPGSAEVGVRGMTPGSAVVGPWCVVLLATWLSVGSLTMQQIIPWVRFLC